MLDQVAQRGVVRVVFRAQDAAIERQPVVFGRHRASPGIGVLHAHGALDDHHAKVQRVEPRHAERGKFVELQIALLHAGRALKMREHALQARFAFGGADLGFAFAGAQAHHYLQVGRIDERDSRCGGSLRRSGLVQSGVLAEILAAAGMRALLAPAGRHAVARRAGMLVPHEIVRAFRAGIDGEQGQRNRHLRGLEYRLVEGVDESMKLCVIR